MRRADNLTTFMCRLSWNLGASTSWNPLRLSKPVMGLLCLTQRDKDGRRHIYVTALDLHKNLACLDEIFVEGKTLRGGGGLLLDKKIYVIIQGVHKPRMHLSTT